MGAEFRELNVVEQGMEKTINMVYQQGVWVSTDMTREQWLAKREIELATQADAMIASARSAHAASWQ